jgi:glutamate synthase (NADPH/NADH) large chain
LGFRTVEEAIGQRQVLNVDRAVNHWKTEGLDLSAILEGNDFPTSAPRFNVSEQDHELDEHSDHRVFAVLGDALITGQPMTIDLAIRNTDRAIGTWLGHELTKLHGVNGLPDDTIRLELTGAAGQSLGAFVPRGITIRLSGDANDYVGKGLSGGRVVVRPAQGAAYETNRNIIAGNVVGYGATSGELFLAGMVGERALVRNSGARAVLEGAGDHALEYMTGGTAVILGSTGRNVGAGMSGGTAYVLDLDRNMVNQASLASGELMLEQPNESDRELLSELLATHVAETGSRFVESLLADPEGTFARITKLLPRDFAAVTAIRHRAEEEGVDPDGDIVWQQIMEVTGG